MCSGWQDRPKGRAWGVAVCIASGPSLTPEDCEQVRQWRDQGQARAAVCTNTTFRLTPWADVLWAMDRAWWDVYHREAKREFKGELWTLAANFHRIPVARIDSYRNSGGGAIALAISRGARRVILLGYDMQKTGGKAHWHGDHPPQLKNAGRIDEWPAQFEKLRQDHPGVEIINCSRATALTCFERRTLEDVLCEPDPT